MSAECDLNTVNEQRSLKIGIKSDKEFFGELKELAGRIDDGWLPEKSIERYHPALPLNIRTYRGESPTKCVML